MRERGRAGGGERVGYSTFIYLFNLTDACGSGGVCKSLEVMSSDEMQYFSFYAFCLVISVTLYFVIPPTGSNLFIYSVSFMSPSGFNIFSTVSFIHFIVLYIFLRSKLG